MPRFSVIVPVFGQPDLLSACLASIQQSTFRDFELLVSDDGSPDPAPIQAAADRFGARVIRSESRRGSAAARNRAVQAATGKQVIFIDADVTVHRDTLTRFAEAFDRNPAPDAVFGSYDRSPGGRNWISHFRNLLHTHGHQRSRHEATTFWTGCGAMDRGRFLELGGFHEGFEGASIEDVELGLRLHRAGGRIRLDPEIQATHHKDWTLRQMVWTDLTARAIPWAALIREHGLPRDLNLRVADRVAAALTALAVPLLLAAALHGAIFWGALAADLLLVAILQFSTLRFFGSARGVWFAIASFPVLLLYNLVCVAGLVAGLVRAETRRDRWLVPSMLAFACLIFGFQIAGDAYHAEFNGSADEAAHFVSSLMVYDYLTSLPGDNPMTWAGQYYLHYPKVSIGHWPPLLYLMEASWWILVPPSRATVMLFNAAILLLAAGIFYCRMRQSAPFWMASGATLLLLAAPVVQESAGQSMAEAVCLLWSVLLTDALVRLLRRPRVATAALTGLWLMCALLTKGTGITLLLAPLLAVLVSGKWRLLIDRRIAIPASAMVIVGLAWYAVQGTLLHQNLRYDGGLISKLPWHGADVTGLAGYGFCGLAVLGVIAGFLRRRPVAVAAGSILISVVSSAWILRAMREPRHFIIVLPAILFLAVEFALWARQYNRFAPAVLVLGIALFPFSFYSQRPAGFLSLLEAVPRPSRMLVSGNAASEGAWIAEVALHEPRPSSTIARASKVLAASDWNGNYYVLRAHTPEEIERKLDELAIDVVIMDRGPSDEDPIAPPPHRALLDRTLQSSRSWQRFASASQLVAYRRIQPAAVPRLPMEIDLRRRIGVNLREH